MNIQIDGLSQIADKLRKMAENAPEIEKKAVEAAGDYLKDKISDNAYKTGLVRRTGKAATSVIKTEYKNGKLEVGYSNQGNAAFYMFFHEFGTSKMKATPVVRPVFIREKVNLINIMADEMKKGMGL
ncbi:HK97-gp10 family putative phage morphogenesis protein [Jeotgalibacillus aurantiacus]|uniref:HK97-gp10 family putative phage morphogenesis protein n=1 Tax=Jeotgalibacillus aurantiacus TaxID=2763266 RepID=UPI001D0B9F5A|nr:HK97-gp10 family putative phage morphogenesis protein [Jeotgalibacillus aurantiacus]